MKISELIARLNLEQVVNGDIDVLIYWGDDGQAHDVDSISYYEPDKAIHIEA